MILSNLPQMKLICFLPFPRAAPLDQFPREISREEGGAALFLRKENHGVRTVYCTDDLVSW